MRNLNCVNKTDGDSVGRYTVLNQIGTILPTCEKQFEIFILLCSRKNK